MKNCFLFIFLILFKFNNAQTIFPEKINGVNFVSPKFKCQVDGIDSLKTISSNWIALCPFALMMKNNSKIEYNSVNNWWGDTRSGLIEEIKRAQACKLKILIKPHYWVINNGWAGNFDLIGKTKSEWEANYSEYMLYLASLCDSLNIEMLSIGTELKLYTQRHPEFFIGLIDKIRLVYKGKLTYAANWDEYEAIIFWDKLDYIGVDAYFPLSEKKTPEIKELEISWQKNSINLKRISLKFDKKIIFTEYGYRSIDYTAYKQWEFENSPMHQNINFVSQINAYSALYNSIWKENFIAGGFIWKWYNDEAKINKQNSDYSPQDKPVLKIIKECYSQK